MAFDSVGMARKAQNRLCKAPWSRVNNEKRNMREYWMWSRNKEMQEEEEEKKTLASLTTNHKQRMPQSGGFRFVWFDKIWFHTAASVSVCMCVHAREYSCSAALPGRKSDLTPPRDPPCMGGIKEQPNWSLCTVFLLVSYSSTQMSTHTFSAHIHATAHTISVLHVGLSLPVLSWVGLKRM